MTWLIFMKFVAKCSVINSLLFLLSTYIGHFQSIKTDVLQIFTFITCDKTEFLSPMMFSN